MSDTQSKTAGSDDSLVIINNKPATAHSMLAALIDIYDDAQNNAPEHRCYVEGAWGDCMREARAFLAAPVAEVVADAMTAFLEAQDALDNRELQGINGEDYSVLMRRRNRARDDLDAALAAPAAAIDAREFIAEQRKDPAMSAAMDRARERLASRSEAPAARPNAAGQEQEPESAASTCYSLDEENFTYEDLYEVLAALDDQDALVEGTVFYQGTSRHPKPSAFFRIDQLFEDMGERAYDECGEWAEDFPDVNVEKKRELEAIVKAWIEANVSLTFWIVNDARRVEVTAEMIAEHLAITAPAATPLEAVGSSGMTADQAQGGSS